jgi:predicted nucleic acid-binding protein
MYSGIIYWDACIFYEWLGKETVSREKSDGIKEVLDVNDEGKNTIITSVATHLEVLPKKLEAKDAEAEAKYLSLFDAEKFCEMQVSTNVILLAREIRDYYHRPFVPGKPGVKAIPATKDTPAVPGVKEVKAIPAKMMDLGDCIHLATAIIEGASEFHTRDNDSKGSKIPLLSLYSFSGQSKVCGKYELEIKEPIAIQGTLDVDSPKKTN